VPSVHQRVVTALARQKKRLSALIKQPGYITVQRRNLTRIPEPTSASASLMPSTGQWRMALDRVQRLLQSVSDQMQAYSDVRSEDWHIGQSAESFHESLGQVNELITQVDDLRSNF
jgi:hypothetical protein